MSKRMFLSLEMVQWFNPPPSRNPHESALAEARIPPEPSNLCPLAVSLSAFFFFLPTAKSKQTQYSETRATVSLKTSFHCLLNTPIRRLGEKFQCNTEEFYVIPLDMKATICTASLKNASCSKQMPQKHKISVDLDNPPSTFIFCLQLFFYGSLAATCSPACWLCQSTD